MKESDKLMQLEKKHHENQNENYFDVKKGISIYMKHLIAFFRTKALRQKLSIFKQF